MYLLTHFGQGVREKGTPHSHCECESETPTTIPKCGLIQNDVTSQKVRLDNEPGVSEVPPTNIHIFIYMYI